MLLSPFRLVTVDLAKIAIHLSRLQGGTAFTAAHGGQVMASVGRHKAAILSCNRQVAAIAG